MYFYIYIIIFIYIPFIRLCVCVVCIGFLFLFFLFHAAALCFPTAKLFTIDRQPSRHGDRSLKRVLRDGRHVVISVGCCCVYSSARFLLNVFSFLAVCCLFVFYCEKEILEVLLVALLCLLPVSSWLFVYELFVFFFCFSLYFVYPLLVVTLSLSSVVFFYCCCFSLFANNAVALNFCFVLLFLYYYNNDFPPLPRGGTAGEPNSVFAHIPSPACSAVALPAQLHCLLLPSSAFHLLLLSHKIANAICLFFFS